MPDRVHRVRAVAERSRRSQGSNHRLILYLSLSVDKTSYEYFTRTARHAWARTKQFRLASESFSCHVSISFTYSQIHSSTLNYVTMPASPRKLRVWFCTQVCYTISKTRHLTSIECLCGAEVGLVVSTNAECGASLALSTAES